MRIDGDSDNAGTVVSPNRVSSCWCGRCRCEEAVKRDDEVEDEGNVVSVGKDMEEEIVVVRPAGFECTEACRL